MFAQNIGVKGKSLTLTPQLYFENSRLRVELTKQTDVLEKKNSRLQAELVSPEFKLKFWFGGTLGNKMLFCWKEHTAMAIYALGVWVGWRDQGRVKVLESQYLSSNICWDRLAWHVIIVSRFF